MTLGNILNAIIFIRYDGFGNISESISSIAWGLRSISNLYKLIDLLFFWESSHCLIKYEYEIKKNKLINHN